MKSILNQSFQDWEMIIVDDGSTDNTRDVVAGFGDERIKYIYQANSERSAARNNGIKHAGGTYILFLDSDDQLKSDGLELLHRSIIQNKEAIAVFGLKRSYINEKGELLSEQFDLLTNQTATTVLKQKMTIPVDQCAHRNCLVNNLFEKRFTLWEDTHLWLRIIQQFPVIGVPEASVFVTIHSESTVAQTIRKVKIADMHRYRDAVFDLLNYPELFPKDKYEQLLKEYIFSKYQMYIYQARMNRQYDIAKTLLSEAKTYKWEIGYHFKTRIKLMLHYMK